MFCVVRLCVTASLRMPPSKWIPWIAAVAVVVMLVLAVAGAVAALGRGEKALEAARRAAAAEAAAHLVAWGIPVIHRDGRSGPPSAHAPMMLVPA